MNNVERIATFFSECDSRDLIKVLILYEKGYLFSDNNLTSEQKVVVLDSACDAIMQNYQASLLCDEHSEIIDEVLANYLEENLEQTEKKRRVR